MAELERFRRAYQRFVGIALSGGDEMDKEATLVQLDEYGYAHLPGPLSPEQAEQLWWRSAENVYLDGKSQRVWNLVNKGHIYEEMIQLPQVLESR